MLEVSQEPVRHRLHSPARRTHRTNEHDINDDIELMVFAIIPALVVHPLAQDFDGRVSHGLTAISLQFLWFIVIET